MVAWWWVLVAYALGQFVAFGAMWIGAKSKKEEQKHKYIKR